MPELPEVETTLRAIRPVLLGRIIERTDVLRPNMTNHDASFAKRMTKRSVKDAKRHGKYLLIELDKDETLIVHLKMSGRLGLRKHSDEVLRYERIRLHIGNNELLIFNDPRTLGRMYLLETKKAYEHPSLKLLGPDALTVSEDVFLKRLEKKKGLLKAVLLDQSFIAGVGNIYADEACFLAKIKPTRRVATLTAKERTTLYKAVMKTLEKGVANMGTSFSDFADLFGKPGQNQKTLMVYGRRGEPCRICMTKLESTKVGQRMTVWCPRCQS